MNPEKDVLVEFMSPQCRTCQGFAEEYTQLGQRLKGIDSLLVAKYDFNRNDVPNEKVKVKHLPTFYFFPASKKDKPLKYKGGRYTNELIAFMQKHASTPFEVPEVETTATEVEAEVASEL
jgi:thioredoxin-like negative regulator of GroEL